MFVCPFMLSIVSKKEKKKKQVNVSTFMSTTFKTKQIRKKKQKKNEHLLHCLQLAYLVATSPIGTCIAR